MEVEDIDLEERRQLVTSATIIAASTGVLVVPRGQPHVSGTGVRFGVTPCSVLPTPFPKRAYQSAEDLQLIVNKLVDGVSRDENWLRQRLQSTMEVDEFTRELVNVFDDVRTATKSVVEMPPNFCVIRNDFMLSQPKGTSFFDASIKHVEINTIAASFGMMSDRITRMHEKLYEGHCQRKKKKCKGGADKPASRSISYELPQAKVEQTLVEGFAAAIKQYNLYCSRHPSNLSSQSSQSSSLATTATTSSMSMKMPVSPEVVVVMVVQPGEYNAFDQYHLQDAIEKETTTRVLRMTLLDMWENRVVEQAEKKSTSNDNIVPPRLLLKDDDDANHLLEVAVVYFRAGYTPADYPEDTFWKSRRFIERSRAIKCPNIAAHLTGTKKIQQELADIHKLERFLSKEEAAALHTSFTGLYSLDIDEYGNEEALNSMLDMFVREPHKYVLKPQREGGGSNFYDEELVDKITSLRANSKGFDELKAFIVQDRITPPIQQSFLMNDSEVGDVIETTLEIGVFGTFVSTSQEDKTEQHTCGRGSPPPTLFHCNNSGGHLLRTKDKDSKEVGVAAGFGFVDSPLLVEEELIRE
eukprot:m.100826 g.100826  ORF g.100826 m.100826 type:complete len:582 (+) comp12557_c0_seq1:34-1779(+)